MATNTYIPIASQTLGSAAASITFSSISSSYTDLRIVFTGHSSSGGNLACQTNGYTGGSYANNVMGASTTTTYGYNTQLQSYINLSPLGGIGGTTVKMWTIDFFSYANTVCTKSILSIGCEEVGGSGVMEVVANIWPNTSAINSIKLYGSAGNLDAGCVATLWGI